MALLEIKGLRTEFSTREGTLTAVDGVTFELNAGETLGLVGESGCGKSVTALSIMRLIPSPSGRIVEGQMYFDGQDLVPLTDDEMRRIRGRYIAMIFQDPMSSLNPVMTIGKQISEALRVHLGLRGGNLRARVVELLTMVGIPDAGRRVDDYPMQFSGGMRQRAMIAMALSCKPTLLLADEITTALDVTIQAQILDLVKGLARDYGTATLLITHDLGIVAGMTQRVNVMYAGQIVETADTTELFANPKMPYTWGLLRSLPRLSGSKSQRLVPIDGNPPSLTSPPVGCRFEPRCPYRRDICRTRDPELIAVSRGRPDHQVRCWGTQDVAGGGWLQETDWRSDLGDAATVGEIRLSARTQLGTGATVVDPEVSVR